MDDLKPWHIVLIIAAVGVLGFSVYKSVFSGGPELPDSVVLVDVKTGDLFRLGIGGKSKAAYYPEKHPDSGERTLMPVRQNDEGQWQISGHSLPALQDVPGDTPAVTDTSRGIVRTNGDNIRRFSK